VWTGVCPGLCPARTTGNRSALLAIGQWKAGIRVAATCRAPQWYIWPQYPVLSSVSPPCRHPRPERTCPVAQAADLPRASAQHTELAVWSEEQLHAFLDSVQEQRLYPLNATGGCLLGRGARSAGNTCSAGLSRVSVPFRIGLTSEAIVADTIAHASESALHSA
jgi:hypothetical protein